MSNNNIIYLKGNLGADPDIRKLQDGRDIATFRIGVSDSYYDKEAKSWKKTETQWFNCIAIGNKLISEARYLKKGALVNVSGSLKINERKNKGESFLSVDVSLSSLEEIVRRKKETLSE